MSHLINSYALSDKLSSSMAPTYYSLCLKYYFSQKFYCFYFIISVLSEEIVADIIKSGFTDVFPLADCKQDATDVIDTESKVNDVGDCENDSNDVVMETKNHIEDSDDKPESEIKERTRKLPTRKSSRRNTSVLQHSEEKQNKKANKRRGRCKAKQDEKGNHYILQCIDCKLKFQSSMSI